MWEGFDNESGKWPCGRALLLSREVAAAILLCFRVAESLSHSTAKIHGANIAGARRNPGLVFSVQEPTEQQRESHQSLSWVHKSLLVGKDFGVWPCHSSGLVTTGQNSATPQVSQERLWLRLSREVPPPPPLEFLRTWPVKALRHLVCVIQWLTMIWAGGWTGCPLVVPSYLPGFHDAVTCAGNAWCTTWASEQSCNVIAFHLLCQSYMANILDETHANLLSFLLTLTHISLNLFPLEVWKGKKPGIHVFNRDGDVVS